MPPRKYQYERLWTGTGFPRHFYLRYDGYRNYFPLMALGQVRERISGNGRGRGAAPARGRSAQSARQPAESIA